MNDDLLAVGYLVVASPCADHFLRSRGWWSRRRDGPGPLASNLPDDPAELAARHDRELPAQEIALTRAEERFRELTQRGYIAVALDRDGASNRMLPTFNPEMERTLFIPR